MDELGQMFGQPEHGERARGVLGQAAVAHLAESPQPLDPIARRRVREERR